MRRTRRRRSTVFAMERLENRSLLTTQVALIDTGVDLNSQQDQPYYDFTLAWNAETDQSASTDHTLVAEDFKLGASGAAHGSIVATEIATGIADATKQSGAGAANVVIVPIRDTDAQGNEDFNATVNGIFYAASHGMKVINLSVNFPTTATEFASSFTWSLHSDVAPDYTTTRFPTLKQALDYATSKGSIVVTGGGNNHWDLDSTDTNSSASDYNGYYAGLWSPGYSPNYGAPLYNYPAYYHPSNMIVTAATDASNNVVSDYGPISVDVGTQATQNATSYGTGYRGMVKSCVWRILRRRASP